MSSEVAHVVRSPLGKPATSLEKTVTPGSKGNSPSTRITREPRGASTSGTSPTLKSAGVSQRRSPGGPRPSYSGKGEKERSLCSPSSSRPKCGDSKCRCATRHSSPGGKYQSKPLVKAVPCSNGKNTRMVCDPKEIQELESAEKKKLSTPRSASTSRSPSPNVQKKSKAGNGGTKAKKTAVKVPEMDADNKTLSQLNANINNLFLEQLRMLLSSLKLDDRGIKEVLRKRVKNHYRNQAIAKGTLTCVPETPLDYFCVMDIEATCEAVNPENYIHEPIELPVSVISTTTKQVEFRFHAYCRPELQPKLSEFCTQLTGIDQETVDKADTFDVVLRKLSAWLDETLAGKSFAFVTDGDADIREFLMPACQRSGVAVPSYWQRWINVRNTLANFYRLNITRMEAPNMADKSSKHAAKEALAPQQHGKIKGMLYTLGLQHTGRIHCGRDDADNIASIVQVMLRDGCCPRVNKSLDGLSGSKPGSPTSDKENTPELSASRHVVPQAAALAKVRGAEPLEAQENLAVTSDNRTGDVSLHAGSLSAEETSPCGEAKETGGGISSSVASEGDVACAADAGETDSATAASPAGAATADELKPMHSEAVANDENRHAKCTASVTVSLSVASDRTDAMCDEASLSDVSADLSGCRVSGGENLQVANEDELCCGSDSGVESIPSPGTASRDRITSEDLASGNSSSTEFQEPVSDVEPGTVDESCKAEGSLDESPLGTSDELESVASPGAASRDGVAAGDLTSGNSSGADCQEPASAVVESVAEFCKTEVSHQESPLAVEDEEGAGTGNVSEHNGCADNAVVSEKAPVAETNSSKAGHAGMPACEGDVCDGEDEDCPEPQSRVIFVNDREIIETTI